MDSLSEEERARAGRAGTCAWRARLAGREAGRLLAGPGFSGQVLAALPGTVYLRGRDEEILWMIPEDLPRHRRCLVAPFHHRLFFPGQVFIVRDSCLHFSSGAVFDLDRTAVWEAERIGPGQAAPMDEVRGCFQRWIGLLPDSAFEEGLGPAIPPILAGRRSELPPSDPLAARAFGPILEIADACLERNFTRACRAGRELIGLGPGLTPSGDDLLGGMLFAARSLEEAYPGAFSGDPEAVALLLDWARERTHPVSHALLSDFSAGQGPEPLHGLAGSLLRAEDPTRAKAALARLLGMGHSTGRDILAGVLIGMLLVFGSKALDSLPSRGVWPYAPTVTGKKRGET